MYVLYTCQLVQTIRKLILKWWVLYFTKKVISRKIVISWKFLIFRNSQFSSKHPEIGDPSTKIPGNLGHTKSQKMQEYTCFLKFSSQNSDFSREISVKIFGFHENLGSTFSRIPGNFGRQNPGKCRNIWVSRNSRAKSQIFPRKFSPKF